MNTNHESRAEPPTSYYYSNPLHYINTMHMHHFNGCECECE